MEAAAKWCVKRAWLVIVTQGEYAKSLLGRDADRAHVIPASWIDEENIISDLDADKCWRKKKAAFDGSLRVLFAGRLDESKGVQILLHTMRILDAEKFPLQLDILGAGELLQDCKNAAKELTGATRIRTLGTIAYGAEFFEFLRGYDAIVVPSISDEQPRVVYDAFSQAVPVLASDTPGLRASVDDKETGIILESNTAAGWADLFRGCSERLDDLEMMGKNGLRKARTMTHREMHARRLKLLQEMLK